MPVVRVTLIEGYSEQTRRLLAERLTDAIAMTIAAPPDGITVVLDEVPAGNYLRGRRVRRPGAPLPAPGELVRGFLAAMEARDLARARAFLAEGFHMTFPGGATFDSLEALVDWARPRYRSVRKAIERIEEAPAAGGAIVVCFGTLAGEWPDGTPFQGVRFIDRFVVKAGKLVEQRVWNDLAEAARPGGAGES